ncbi:MAG: rod shape-determining protein MreC [Reichenbachiella sp.]
MGVLFQFLFKYRTFLLFVVLEGFCFWIIVNNNSYHRAEYFTSSNRLAASIYNTFNSIEEYFELKQHNVELAAENAMLKQLLLVGGDTSKIVSIEKDTIDLGLSAKVIDNSIFYHNNFITINKGSLDGVLPKMGVIGPNGIVGQVKDVSSHYATVVSILHSKSYVSSKHNKSNALCTIIWDGEDPMLASIKYLPRHINLAIGDSISTSGYNSIFPANEMVGIVTELSLTDAATFYNAKIELTTDFYELNTVYLLSLQGKEEIDSLNNLVEHERE